MRSRAPETNLFNLPRIACWPIYKDLAVGHVTAFDKLIAFCASTGNPTAASPTPLRPYYFQREQAMSPTNDLSSAIQRNVDLYGYLQYLTSQAIPGFGGNFSTKYGDDRDQILTEIFDYIRSTNLYDDNLATGNQFTNGRVTATPQYVNPGHGWVVPIKYNTTMGFGRFYTLSEFGIGFICNAVADDPATTGTDESCGSNIATGAGANAVLGGTPLASGEKYIQAILLPEFFSPMMGFTIMRPADLTLRISGLETLQVTCAGVTQNLFPPGLTSGAATYSGKTGGFGGVSNWLYDLVANNAPLANSSKTLTAKDAPARGNLAGDSYYPDDVYPFIGIPVKITSPPTSGTMTFGGSLKVEILSGSNLIQTIPINFPSANIPIPKIAATPIPQQYPSSPVPDDTKEQWWSFSKGGSISGKQGRLSFLSYTPGGYGTPFPGQFLRTDCDVVRSVIPRDGDYRLIAANPLVSGSAFLQHSNYTSTSMAVSSLGGPFGNFFLIYDRTGKYFTGLSYSDGIQPDIDPGAIPAQRPENSGDVDTGYSTFVDGPYTNKPDEGNTYRDSASVPYFDNASTTEFSSGATFFSPNRIMPSPGMFGSLPTGVKANIPWKTLLFRPQPTHPSYVDPATYASSINKPSDHLLMDLFWMPVVEPYAISDRFSTAGKINLNYQILPFTYIERATGMHALLKSELITAIPNSKGSTYKKHTTASLGDTFRMQINIPETLKQFQAKFASNQVFKSASEICDQWIVPNDGTLLTGTMSNYWNSRQATGDNLRERIYTTLYPRVTTKSNTYTVHFRAQALRKSPSSIAGTWTENKDFVTGEYRGSTTIERFIDSNNPNIPDYAANPSGISSMDTLDRFYRWRVIANKQFAP